MSIQSVRLLLLLVALLTAEPSAWSRGDQPEAYVPHGQRKAGRDCLECHQPMQLQIELPVPHEPVAKGECTGCHAVHAARYPKLLNKRERSLCFTCHEEQKLSFMAASIHTPVRQGQCTVCHEVHGSEHASLLVAEGSELCFGCHEDKRELAASVSAHEPFKKGECSACHDPHASATPAQLKAPGSALCQSCHDASTPAMIGAHHGFSMATAECTQCHDPHSGQGRGLMLAVRHEPFATGDCAQCHLENPGGAALLVATGGQLCWKCHQDYPRAKDTVIHEPVALGSCEACHSPHASSHAGLLRFGPDKLCADCHADMDTRRAKARSAHPLRSKDVSCLSCHQPHSSREEHLLSSGGIRTCMPCHPTERHGHPLGEDHLDPRTGSRITCVTCHDPHGTDFPYQLRGDQSRGLCLECHSNDSDALNKKHGR